MSESAETKQSKTHEEIAQMVLRERLGSRDEVKACLAAFQEQNSDNSISFERLLLERQVVTPNQLRRLLKPASNNQIPGYQLLERIGEGCMGVVFKARQLSMSRLVAIKVLAPRYAENAEFIERFGREARLAAKLSSGNIVQAIDVGKANGFFYFVMEYVEGVTIQDELDKPRMFTERETLETGIQIAEALKHASARGLVHRDIKPANVLLAKDGAVKLADLGLARSTRDFKVIKNEAGQSVGTAYYISPEQIRGLEDVDVRSDIYSLGATMYHMATGAPPFPGDTITEQLTHHLQHEFISPHYVNTDLSEPFGELVGYMMARDRNGRYRTPADLVADMKSVLRRGAPFLARERIPKPMG